jgi:hypothetical protein
VRRFRIFLLHSSRLRLFVNSGHGMARTGNYPYYQQVLLPITFLRLCDIESQRSFGT